MEVMDIKNISGQIGISSFIGPLGYDTLFTLTSRTSKDICHPGFNWISDLSNKADMELKLAPCKGIRIPGSKKF